MRCDKGHVLLHDPLAIIEDAIEGRIPPGIPRKFPIYISTEES